MALVDLEFNSHKLIHETQSFLEVTRDKDPKNFQRMEKSNKLWIDFRLLADGPLDVKELIDKHLEEEDWSLVSHRPGDMHRPYK